MPPGDRGCLLETRDVTASVDGRLVSVGALDAAVGALAGVISYRLDQPAAATYELRLVSQRPREDVAAAQAALKRVYGEAARVSVIAVEELPPEPSGKYRLAASAVAPAVEACCAVELPLAP